MKPSNNPSTQTLTDADFKEIIQNASENRLGFRGWRSEPNISLSQSQTEVNSEANIGSGVVNSPLRASSNPQSPPTPSAPLPRRYLGGDENHGNDSPSRALSPLTSPISSFQEVNPDSSNLSQPSTIITSQSGEQLGARQSEIKENSK